MKRLASLNRLTKLRALLRCKKLHAYILPSEDEHFSEYVDPSDQRCAFISGFTGSVCTTIITLDKAALWADGRYHLQASQQLDDNWTLMKKGLEGVPTEVKWLAEVTPSGSLIGYDPRQIPFTTVNTYKNELRVAEAAMNQCSSASENVELIARRLVPMDGPNLVDLVWNEMRDTGEERSIRPPRTCNPVHTVPLSFAGETWQQKVRRVLGVMCQHGASLLALSALDEVAWLLNLRGSDIQCSPVFFSYVLLSSSELKLFLDLTTVASSADLVQHLSDSEFTVSIHPYHEFLSHLERSVSELPTSSRVWLDYRASEAIVIRVPETMRLFRNSPVSDLKSVKLPSELSGIRAAHIEDSLVLCDFLAWLEHVAEANRSSNPKCRDSGSPLDGRLCDPAGNPPLEPPETLTESSVADYLDRLRSQAPGFVSLSFKTIFGADANGAIIHYRAVPGQDASITDSTFYLVDSGGQYHTGTTDVTRTLHLGEPTAKQKACYTLVLKSHIALADQIFPPNTPGSKLDVVARRVAWRFQCDYAHGTGHGVGAFLGVHEGPISMSGSRLEAMTRMGMTEPGVQKNMVLTIEPGYYLANEFGIRLENVVFVRNPSVTENIDLPPCSSVNEASWLGFEPVTLVPFQRRMINRAMLDQSELKWLNDYHAVVRRVLTQRLQTVSSELQSSYKRCLMWILKETEPMA
ncbi:Xaa-Pro aminopeptidase [Fasciola hepatica]|uniref:Xaa-Pro aminopeptidase n=1 Tax=Fasciola hepatica TaxID=6192 RepID=A0A4E0R5E9_FASHE|nr:Xaa-Pro aminopeptidase [Fasciola hepatica]